MPAPRQDFFRHQRLDTDVNSTRLLKLLPGADDSDIQCELYNVALPVNEPYAALSYEWGQTSTEYLIMVNGVKFAIPDNLHAFLCQIRSQLAADLPMLIWVDAVCIDQFNTGERNHQVNMMKQIYSQAQETLAWIGEAADGSSKLFEVLNSWLIIKENMNRLAAISTPFSQQASAINQEISQASGFREVWQNCTPLAWRSYWTRAWIIQEISLVNHVRIFAGRFYLHHGAFKLIDILAYLDANRAIHGRSLFSSPMCAISSVTLARHQKNNLSLWDLVLLFQKSKTTIIHDRIYSLLGLAANTSRFAADYNLPPLELYWQVVATATHNVRGVNLRTVLRSLELAPSSMECNLTEFTNWSRHFHGLVQQVGGGCLGKLTRIGLSRFGTVSEVRQLSDGEGVAFKLEGHEGRFDTPTSMQDGDTVCHLYDFRLWLVLRDIRNSKRLIAAATRIVEGTGCSRKLSKYACLSDAVYATNANIFERCACQIEKTPTSWKQSSAEAGSIALTIELLLLAMRAEPWYSEPLYQGANSAGDHQRYNLSQVWPSPASTLNPSSP